MKRRISNWLSLLLVFALLMSTVSFFGVSAATSATVVYDFIGDEANMAGFAQGLITITPSASGSTSGYYLVYYTNGTNVLTNYDDLAYAPITGDVVRIEIKDGTMIPEGAKGIAVFESNTRYLDNAPNISSAIAKCAIPASKQLTLSGAELVFGLASDVHMNYEGTGAGAHGKWAKALKFYNDNGATHLVVTGDMTGDASDVSMGENFSLENQYKKYMELVTAAGFTKETAIECIGNHSNTTADRGLFTTYTSGSNEVHPSTGSAYFHVLLKGKNGAKDNLFIVLQQELDAAAGGYKASQSANVDNFSKTQMDWFEGLMKTYGNSSTTNVFVLCHSPFRNYGAGEKYNGTYSSLLTFKDEYPQNMRFKRLLETYHNVTVFSGHTHQSLYDGLNYSNMGNTFAHTVHVPSTAAPRAYKNGTNTAWYDTRKGTDATYGSETYVVKVYKDYVVYIGYNVSTGKYIPAGCLIVPTKLTPTASPDDVFEGSGTASDPYLIQDEGDFLALTNGMNSATTEANKYADSKYFKQTANINMTGIDAYIGTHANGGVYANGDARCYFGGNYDGNGYEIKVNIRGPEQRSVFPYCYGTLSNVVIRGDIISDYAAQPVRTNRGNIINCIFDCYLDAYMTSGVVYSNYTYMYNVYTSGMMKGTSLNPVSSGSAGDAYVWNVFHHYVSAGGGAITESSVGTYSDNLSTVAEWMNTRDTIDYSSAADIIKPAVMSKAGIIVGQLRLGHDGDAPVVEDIPKSGNIAPYATYTTSQLYRQGGAEVDWGWDSGADIAYPDESGSSLTDGALASAAKYSDKAWIGFHSKGPEYISKGYHNITFDFGTDVNVGTVNVFVGTKDLQQGIDAPDKIEVYCDGKYVTSVEPTDVTTEADIATEKVAITVEKTAKTVELRFTNYAWVFVSEVQIMAYTPSEDDNTSSDVVEDSSDVVEDSSDVVEDSSDVVEDSSDVVEDSSDVVEDSSDVVEDSSDVVEDSSDVVEDSSDVVEDSSDVVEDSSDVVEDSSDVVEDSSDVVEDSSDVVEDSSDVNDNSSDVNDESSESSDSSEDTSSDISDSDTSDDEEDVETGDINENGKIDMTDYILLKRAYFGTYTFNDRQNKAGDINDNGKIDMTDYILLKRIYFGTYTLKK